MRHPRTILAALVLSLVVACSGPPPAPKVEAVSPQVAGRGDTITITGTDFGADGTVTVGDVAATVLDWTPTSIQVTVPATAPNAWQAVTVTNPLGSSTFGELFVGVGYEGAAGDLQAFLDAQDEGTAVLLEAGEYAVGAGALGVDGRDLYGRGREETTLSFDDDPASGIRVQPGLSFPATVADMEIVTSQLVLGRRVSVTPAPTGAAPAGELGAQAVEDADVTLSGLYVRDAGSAGALNVGGLLIIGQAMSIVDTTIALPTIRVDFDGDLALENVTLEGVTELFASASLGSISVLGSELIVAGDIYLAGAGGLTVDSSTLTALDGQLTLDGESGLPDVPGGHIVVRNSVLEALDADPDDGTRLGYVDISTRDANVTLEGNERIVSDDHLSVYVVGTAATEVRVTGNAVISAGVPAGATSTGRAASIYIEVDVTSPERSELTVQDNEFRATEDVVFVGDSGSIVDAAITDNSIAVGHAGVSGDLSFWIYGESEVTVAANQISLRGGSVELGGSLATSLELTSNTFDADQPSEGITVYDFGETTMTSNTFTAVDAADTAFALTIRSMFEGLSLTATENAFTGYENGILVWDDEGPPTVFDVAINRNVFDSEFGPASRTVELRHVGQVIDATDNRWGGHTESSAVEALVVLDPDTVSLGGGVDLAPIRAP